MKPNKRFIQSVIKTAQQCQTTLPFTRGSRRAAMIAKRKTQTLSQKSA